MALCPSCSKDLTFGQVSEAFDCPYCRTALKSNSLSVLWFLVPVAILLEAGLYFGLYEWTNDGTLVLILLLSVGGLATFIAYWGLGHFLTRTGVIKVELNKKDSGVPRAI